MATLATDSPEPAHLGQLEGRLSLEAGRGSALVLWPQRREHWTLQLRGPASDTLLAEKESSVSVNEQLIFCN